jgi:hypothetical protein
MSTTVQNKIINTFQMYVCSLVFMFHSRGEGDSYTLEVRWKVELTYKELPDAKDHDRRQVVLRHCPQSF